jgi:hypothetical protein
MSRRVREIGVDGAQVVVLLQMVEQSFSHAHQRRRAAGSKVEAPDQLLAARLSGEVEFAHGFRRWIDPIGLDSPRQPHVIAAEFVGEPVQESELARIVERLVARQHRAREGDPRGLAAARQQRLA